MFNFGIVYVEQRGTQVWTIYFVKPGFRLVRLGKPSKVFAGYVCDYNSHNFPCFCAGEYSDFRRYMEQL